MACEPDLVLVGFINMLLQLTSGHALLQYDAP